VRGRGKVEKLSSGEERERERKRGRDREREREREGERKRKECVKENSVEGPGGTLRCRAHKTKGGSGRRAGNPDYDEIEFLSRVSLLSLFLSSLFLSPLLLLLLLLLVSETRSIGG